MAELLKASIELIRRKAREARVKGGYEYVHLGAHLFAIGEQLLENPGDAHVGSRYVESILRPAGRIETLLAQLEELPDDLDAENLYLVVEGSLKVIADAPEKHDEIPTTTRLDEPLGGVVLHWLRDLSVLARERDLRYDGAGAGRPPSPPPNLDKPHAHRLAFFWESDSRPPRIQRIPPPDDRHALFHESGSEACRMQRFRIALCPLKGPYHPRFQVNPSNHAFFRAHPEHPMENREALHEHLEAVLKAARDEEVHLLVFPELTVDAAALRSVMESLKTDRRRHPFGVVAGSFHTWGGETRKADDWRKPLPHNELVVLDNASRPLAVHRKRGRFRIFSKFLEKPSALFPGEPVDRNGLPLEIFEEIEYGSELQFLDTTLGRLAFLICADAIAPDDRGYLPVIRRLRPDLLIVIAMSHETEPFETFAAEMSRHGIGTLVVNASCICEATARPSAPPPSLALSSLALYELHDEAEKMPTAPPTRARWLYNCGEAHCRYFKTGFKDWHDVPKAPTPTGISWFGPEKERLGVIVDLGPHLLEVRKP